MKLGFAALAFAAGVAVSIQASANAQLSRFGGLGPALVTNTTIVLGAALLLWLATGANAGFLPAGAPWSAYLGGFCGFAMLAAAALAFPKLGAAWAVALIVLGQAAAALAIDHFGLLGMERVALTPLRAAGIALVVAGVGLLRL